MLSGNESFYYPINPNQRLIFKLTFLSAGKTSFPPHLPFRPFRPLVHQPTNPPFSLSLFSSFTSPSPRPLSFRDELFHSFSSLPLSSSSYLVPPRNLISASLSPTALVKHGIMGAGILLSWAASESEPVKSSFQSIIKYACEAAYSPRSTPFMHERRNNGPRNTIPFCFIVQKCKSDDADDT